MDVHPPIGESRWPPIAAVAVFMVLNVAERRRLRRLALTLVVLLVVAALWATGVLIARAARDRLRPAVNAFT